MCPRKLSVQLKILKTFMKKLIFVKTFKGLHAYTILRFIEFL